MKGLAFIINTSSYERVAYALSLAAISAARGNETILLFAFNGILRLLKGNVDILSRETNEPIRHEISRGLEKGSVQRISYLIKNIKDFGGKIYACSAAMALHNVTKDDLIEDVDGIMGLATFLELVGDDSKIIYV